MSLKKILDKTDQRTQFTVYGWIRRQERAHKLPHIPLLISASCIIYYREDEIFCDAARDIKLSSNNKIMIKTSTDISKAHCYGLNKISSLEEYIYRWDLRMNHFVEPEHGFNCVLGITSKTSTHSPLYSLSYDICQYIFRNGCRKLAAPPIEYDRWQNYGNSFTANDIVSI